VPEIELTGQIEIPSSAEPFILCTVTAIPVAMKTYVSSAWSLVQVKLPFYGKSADLLTKPTSRFGEINLRAPEVDEH
jgi:hypothetical protein